MREGNVLDVQCARLDDLETWPVVTGLVEYDPRHTNRGVRVRPASGSSLGYPRRSVRSPDGGPPGNVGIVIGSRSCGDAKM